MPNAATEPPVARFTDDVADLIGTERCAGNRFGVAVSGGPDSMALLWLAVSAFPERTLAATVDHRLRSEARAEAEMVAHWCAEHAVPHTILSPTAQISGNIQAAARAARYALLKDWRAANALDWLLTAHHADDQLETMLMRLNRSSGVGGLAGVRPRNGRVLRPLLGWRRTELLEVVKTRSLPHIHDPSNQDSRFDRAEMRKHLASVDWLDPIAASRSAHACADADEALDWTTKMLAHKHVHRLDDGRIALDAYDFPREIQRRLVLHMLREVDPGDSRPRGDTIDQAVVQLLRGKKAAVGKWLLSGGTHWILSLAPPRRAP